MTTGLASTVHDPDGRLAPLLAKHGASIREWYANATAAVTSATSDATARALREAGIEPVGRGDDGIGEARRLAVRAAAEGGATSVLYCDLDRWLHWRERFPDELRGVPARLATVRPTPWYACLGRTPRAFGTHPKVQVACEDATNRAASAAFRRRSDVTAGAAWLAPEGIRLVLERSTEWTNATDGEWPSIVWSEAPQRVAQAWFEGLEFETATFYPDEVGRAGGVEAWVRLAYDTPEAWSARLALASATAAAVVRVLGPTRREGSAT